MTLYEALAASELLELQQELLVEWRMALPAEVGLPVIAFPTVGTRTERVELFRRSMRTEGLASLLIDCIIMGDSLQSAC